ncbi:MAG: hypothetical protein PW735_10800 [Acidobacteriaceae bacterium]|nr:hypothetical protein [Acidobacteriaceae bacterium]
MIRITARHFLAAGLLAVTAALPAFAQEASSTHPKLQKQLERMDFGLNGMYLTTKSVSGIVEPNGASTAGDFMTQKAGNTAGLLANLRYSKRPYVGGEFNYTYARYTETFNVEPYQIQTGVNEVSFGYLALPPHQILGLQPFFSAGAGSTRFRPTRGGGQSAPTQWRATYYYNVGLQSQFPNSHFGFRFGFRQAFYKAPDFLLNYLTINQHTYSLEPNFGVYVKF